MALAAVVWWNAPVSTETSPRPKPRLRGWPHLVAALCALPAAIALVRHAGPGIWTTAALVYGLALVVLLSTSAFYHVPMWSPERRMLIRRFDRSAIYVLIAGTYTPMCASIGGEGWSLLMPLVWGGAAAGILMVVAWVKAPRWLTATPYVVLGWAIIPYLGDLYRAIGALSMALIASGGVAYTIGALVYARRRPDPVPEVFGYHEVFHVLVVVAAALQYAAVWRMIAPA